MSDFTHTSTTQNESNEDAELTIEKLEEAHKLLNGINEERKKALENAVNHGFRVAINPLINNPVILFPKEYESALTELIRKKQK